MERGEFDDDIIDDDVDIDGGDSKLVSSPVVFEQTVLESNLSPDVGIIENSGIDGIEENESDDNPENETEPESDLIVLDPDHVSHQKNNMLVFNCFCECFVIFCSILYHLYNLKNMKNTHGGVLLLVKLRATILHGCFSCFLNCTSSTKSRKASQLKK